MEVSGYLYLSHNISNLVYQIVYQAKYRRVVFDDLHSRLVPPLDHYLKAHTVI